MNLFFPVNLSLPVKSRHTNSKFGGTFLPPVSGVDFANQTQNRPKSYLTGLLVQ